MRRVSKRLLRVGAAVLLVSVVSGNAAYATTIDQDNGWLARFQRFTHLIVVTLADELGMPPG